MTTTNSAVSARALQQRINRRLARKNQLLCKARRAQREALESKFDPDDMGDYFVIDTARNDLVDTYVDIEALGRKLGVLADGETVAKK